MLDIDLLITKIETLRIAEQNDALQKPNIKISDLKKASYDLCAHIHNEILKNYPENQLGNFPVFNNATPFNVEYLNRLKSHTCYAVYLKAKNIPAEAINLNYYLTMTEQHGFPFIRVVEFYKNNSAKFTSAITGEQLRSIYVDSQNSIKEQFTLDTGKGRFLDLMMMLQLVNTAQSGGENDCRKLVSNFKNKIEAALKLFIQKLEDPTTAEDFDKFFKTGTLHPFYSANAFIGNVNSVLSNTNVIDYSQKRPNSFYK